MKEYTVSEYSDLTGIPERTIRNRIKAGQLASKKKMVNNREITYVLASSDTQETLEAEVINDHMPANEKEFTGHIPAMAASHEMAQVLREMTDKIANYAELAGQARLLTDSESRTRQQFFELQQEYKAVIEERAILKGEKIQLATQIEILQKENKELINQAALFEADVKISKMRIEELEIATNPLQEKLSKLENENKLLQEENVKLLEEIKKKHQGFLGLFKR